VSTRPIGRLVTRLAHTHRGYALAHSVAQLRTRPIATTVTLSVLALVLALPALLLFADHALGGLAQRDTVRPSVTVYLDPSLSDLEGAERAGELASRPGVERTRYLSRDEALATLQRSDELGDVLGELGDNPLPGSIVIYPDALPDEPGEARRRIGALVERLSAEPGVDQVHYDLVWVERLGAVLSLLSVATVLLTALLLLTALTVIGNTIRLELLRRRAEREVADLLGASASFRDRPFLYTGALFGLLGGLLALVLSVVARAIVKVPADELATLYGGDALPLLPPLGQLVLIPAVGLALGITGALSGLYGPSRVKVRTQR